MACLQAAPCCVLEVSGVCVRGDVPYPRLGLRVCGRTDLLERPALTVQIPRFLGCFCCVLEAKFVRGEQLKVEYVG